MSLYKPYTSEQIIHNYSSEELQELDYVDNFAKLLKENLNRFLGVPKIVQPVKPPLEAEPQA